MTDKKRYIMIASRLLLAVTLAFISWQATTHHGIEVHVTNSDKVLHALAFCTLSLLVDCSFPRSRFGVTKIVMLIGYGILIEVVQSFLPYRSAEVADVLADTLGICVYMASIPLLRHLLFYQEYRQ